MKQINNYDLDCIIAIDETAVWHEMISNTTVKDKGAKSVVLKTTGHEKSKVTVTLAAKANGDKLKPYIVFPGHKRKVPNLKKYPAIKNRCYVKSTINGRMNENTTIDWIENILQTFTFGKRELFVWGSFRAHLVQSVKEKSTTLSFLVEECHSSGRRIMKQVYKRSTCMTSEWMRDPTYIPRKVICADVH